MKSIERVQEIDAEISKSDSRRFNMVFGSEHSSDEKKAEIHEKLRQLYAAKFDALESLQQEIELEKQQTSLRQQEAKRQVIAYSESRAV